MRRVVMSCCLVLVVVGCAPEVAEVPGDDVAVSSEGSLVYGTDDRREYYALTDPRQRALAESTVGLFDMIDMQANVSGYRINTSTSFASAYSLCSTEPFRTQPTTAFCSGVLVGPDLVATAGHCIDAASCSTTAFVFGFRMDSATTVRANVPASDVYGCASVVSRVETSTNDYAIVRLNRAVTGRSPVVLRRSGAIATGTPLIVAGHPAGIPLKVAANATVRSASQADYFEANLDTYGGNSGSPVINATTGELEGLLVRGNTDFTYNRTSRCYVSNVCSDTGCPGWEDVTRTAKFASFVPASTCSSDASCSDGNPCNGVERCELATGRCVGGAPVDCGDALGVCTTDACVRVDATTFTCSHTPVSCNDGNACTVDLCDPVTGCGTAPVACDNGSDGCCSPGCDGIDPDCDVPACGAYGTSCGTGADCCSGRCHKKQRVCQ